jgi:dTDP-glucose pyrophosphorylase
LTQNPTNSKLPKKDWRKTLLSSDATLQKAISVLDEAALKIALVINPDSTFVGTITDGDIRRGLLNGMDINSLIGSVINKNPLIASPVMSRESVLKIMQANDLYQVPIIDENQHVIGLHIWDEIMIPKQRPNKMVIMAGGLGTRLRPHTENCPKPLLPVGGKPMLEHIIERAKSEGFTEFVLTIHYLGHMIEEYFGDGSRLQVNIDYLREDKPLGTAGSISLLNPLPDNPILVTNGDVLTDIHYGEMVDFHCRHEALATMAVRLHEWQHPFGVVHTEGPDIIEIEEKPVSRSNINAGIYVLEPRALEEMEFGEHCDMPNLFSRLQKKQAGRTIVYPIHEPWLDVGLMNDYQSTDKGNAQE